MITIHDNYINSEGWTCELGEDNRGLFVRMWNPENELHWEMRGRVLSNVGKRQTREPYTLDTAKAEFERWR